MMREIQIAGTWREDRRTTTRKIPRQHADAELKRLCGKYLQENSEKEVRQCK